MTESTSLSMRDRVARLRLPQTVAAATSGGRISWLPWSLTLLLAVSTFSLAMRPSAPAQKSRAGSGPAVTSSGSMVPPAAVVAPGAVVLESKGYIIPAHQIQVSPIEVSGRIVQLNIEEGKRFKQGDVLAVLDTSSFEAEHAEALATQSNMKARLDELKNGARPEEIDQAAAELREAEETLKVAKLRFERNQNLGPGTLSADEFEQAQYAYTALTQRVRRLQKQYDLTKLGPRQERIAGGEAELKVADARLRKATWRLENCTIRAPVSGTILKKTAELGNLVSPLSFNVAASVCEMADLADLEVELEINERDIAKVRVGQKCKIRTEAWPDRRYDGVVDRLMPIANRSKGAVPVRVKVAVPKDEEGAYLKPEMGAFVSFIQSESKP